MLFNGRRVTATSQSNVSVIRSANCAWWAATTQDLASRGNRIRRPTSSDMAPSRSANLGRMNQQREEKPRRTDENVPLAPAHLLVTV